MRYFSILVEGIWSLNRFILSYSVLRLGRKKGAWLSCTGSCFGCKVVFFEKTLLDKFFQVPSEASVMDDLVYLAFVKRTIFFSSEKYRVVWIGFGILHTVGP